MQSFRTLVRRELSSFFLSWTGYVIVAAALFLLGFGFSSMMKSLNAETTSLPLRQLFYDSLYFWIVPLVVAPVITMRSFALEKSSGTYETLMTTPVSEGAVVLAKFVGALFFYMVLWMPLSGCLLIVRYYTNDATALEPAVVTTTYLGVFLLGMLFLAMGVFASALTRSQIIAVIVALAMGITLFLLSFLSSQSELQTGWVGLLIGHLDLRSHMHDFAEGLVDTRALVFYPTLTVFFLFLTWRVVESRRWK